MLRQIASPCLYKLRKTFSASLHPQYFHPSYCFYALIWGVVAGIVLSLITTRVFITTWLWLIVIFLAFLYSKRFPTRIAIIIMFFCGAVLANFRVNFELTSQNFFRAHAGETLTLRGQVAEDPDTDASRVALRLNNLSLVTTESSSDRQKSLAGMLYVQLPAKSVELERSDFVTLTGKVNSGFGTFVATMFRPSLDRIERAEHGDIFARFKQFFAETIHNFLPSPQADLGLGYLMGLKTGLPDSLTTTLQAVGMTHVIVASGAHLGIIVNLVKKIFGKFSKFASLLFSLLMILCFAFTVGFTPSMTRAALVSSLSLTVGYFGRKFTPIRLLSLVAALTLLINPMYLYNLGWQLSFASFAGLLIVGPRLQKILYSTKQPPWLASMLLTSFSTSLLCAPILIYSYGTLSVLSFAANLIILPTLPYVMLLIFLVGLTGMFIAPLARILAYPALWLLDLHIFVVNFLSEQTGFIFELPSGNPTIFLLYLPILFCLILPKVLHCAQRYFSVRHQPAQHLVNNK